MATVKIINEVPTNRIDDWQLCFQQCVYYYDNGDKPEEGYRFIWRRPETHYLQAARGQARIPDKKELEKLLKMAEEAGWYK